MEIKINKTEEGKVVEFIGRLDTPAALEANETLAPLFEGATGTTILDCEKMTYISSSGLRIFLTLRKSALQKGGKVIVRSINDDIRSVFLMTGFLNLFEIQ